MSAHNEQNGRHSDVSVHSVAPSDPRVRNLAISDQSKVCRDYVWGICNKHGLCKFRHECSLEEMKTIIRFCHDHQNRTGCLRPDCTYLHTSSEEENLFLTAGKLPRVLLERHAAMNTIAAAVANGVPIESSAPVYIAQPPPPPPPPPPQVVSAPPPPPPPQPVATVMAPPPPPPPTEPCTLRAVPAALLYTAPPPQHLPSFTLNRPPPPLPIFDASRPPPPLPADVRNSSSIKRKDLKRSMADACEAGPSKQRILDDGKLPENLCDMCIQRELSSKMCAEEMEKLNRQKEYKKLLYKSKTEELESFKAMLKFLLPAEMCLAVEKYIDGEQSQPLGLSVLKQLMMSRLFDDKISKYSNIFNTMQSSSMRELFMGCLPGPSTSTERPMPIELRPNEMLGADGIRASSSSISNGYSRFVSGQRAGTSSQSAPGTPSAYGVYSNTPSAPRPPAAHAAAEPLHFPQYQPAVPPPAVRPPYPTYAPPPILGASSALAPTPFQNAPRAGVPPQTLAGVPPQPRAGPSTSAPAPVPPPATNAAPPAPPNGHTYNQFMMSGYHSTHYYPPFQ